MKTFEITPSQKRKFHVTFIVLIIWSYVMAFVNYIIWMPGDRITSMFYKTDGDTEQIVLHVTRNLEYITQIVLFCLTLISVILAIWKRKFFWYALVAILTVFFISYLDRQAYYLPN